MKDLIEGSGEMDLEPKPTSLWWTSTYADVDESRVAQLPFENKFKILGFTSNQAGKMQDSLDEKMQGANEAW